MTATLVIAKFQSALKSQEHRQLQCRDIANVQLHIFGIMESNLLCSEMTPSVDSGEI